MKRTGKVPPKTKNNKDYIKQKKYKKQIKQLSAFLMLQILVFFFLIMVLPDKPFKNAMIFRNHMP